MKKTIVLKFLAGILIFFSVNSLAGILTTDIRSGLAEDVLNGFWGNARDIKGQRIFPINDKDRKTIPISAAVIDQTINVGEMSGMAEWCGLDWKPYYKSLTSYARKQKMTDKQVAFISVLHGASSQIIVSAMKAKTCEKQDKENVIGLLKKIEVNWQ
jgi:hypothetical protein